MKRWLVCALALCGCDHLLGIGDLVEGDAGLDAVPGFGTPPSVAFGPATSLGLGTIQQLALADLDGDGRLDVVIAITGSLTRIEVFLNQITNDSHTIKLGGTTTVTTGSAPNFAVADLDGDGKADLVINNGTSIDVFLSTTTAGAMTASFAAKVSFVVQSTADVPVAGDFTGDGKLDVVAPGFVEGQVHGAASVLVNGSSAGSASFATAQTSMVDSSRTVLAADLDGDGRADLVVPFNSMQLDQPPDKTGIFMNTSAGNVVTLTSAANLDGAVLAIGDLNGDHLPDLITSDAVQLNTTAAGVVSFSAMPLAVSLAPLVAADVNGDGTPDLVSAQGTGLQLLLNGYVTAGLPTVEFTTVSIPSLAHGSATHITAIAIGDLNGDGKPDVVFAADNDSTFLMLAE